MIIDHRTYFFFPLSLPPLFFSFFFFLFSFLSRCNGNNNKKIADQTQQDSYTFRIPYSSAAVDATTVISPIFHLGKSLWESMTSHDIENPTQLPNPTNISEEKNDCTIVASPPTNWLARFSFLYHPDVEFEDFSPKVKE